MKKWLLRVLGILLLLASAVALVTWVQVRRVRSHLAVDAPLSIADATRDGRAAERDLQARVKAQLPGGQGRFRLTSADATLVLQSILKSPASQGTLRAERRRLLAMLTKVPDPLGLLAELHLEAVDLRRLQGDVAFAGDRATVRLSAPYGSGPKAGKHLNLELEAEGQWRSAGTAQLTLHRLAVGGLDLLGVVPYGSLIRRQVEQGLQARAATITLGPLVGIAVSEGMGVFTVVPGEPLPAGWGPRPAGPAGSGPAGSGAAASGAVTPPRSPASAAAPIPYELPPEEAAP